MQQIAGKRVYFFGGKNYQKDSEVREVDCYSVKTRRWRNVFQLPERYSYTNMECVRLRVPTHNADFSFSDVLLYDKWIMW